MSLRKFNAMPSVTVEKVKAHHTYLRPKKEKPSHRSTDDWEGDWQGNCKAPWEIGAIKGLCAGKPKKNLDRDRIFDTKNDGKSLPKKKETKHEKLSRAYVMRDSKKYHEVDGRYVAAGL